MASAFNLTAQINLRGPTNLKPIVADIKRQLGTISSDVNIKLSPQAAKSINAVTSRLKSMNDIIVTAKNNTDSLNASLSSLSTALSGVGSSGNKSAGAIGRTAATTKVAAQNIKQATTEMEQFGKQSALAIRRFAAFSIVSGAIYKLVNAINSGFSAFVSFDKQLVKLQQVTGKGAIGLKNLENQITSLATSLGVSSESLIEVASTLAQAGLSAEETRIALSALAKTELAPSFDNLTDTTEGAIAALRQFELQAGDLEAALGSINAVAAAFAVESSDIITAIQRTGGVFAAASKGVSEGKDALNEFIAVFTSVRATTRESAETIATGLRTIFTRIQRGKTIEALKEYGVVLTDLEGKFVGPYEAIKRLSEGLKLLDPRDLRFSQIVEELGGFRQIGKVIPLIQQFSEAQKALKVAQTGQSSLTDAQITAQKSLANQIAKVREQFLALIRDVGKSATFQAITKIVLGLTSAFISLAGAFKPILPFLAILGTIKGVKAIGEFGTGFFGGLRSGGKESTAKNIGSNIGSSISGNKEKEKAEATKRASEAIKLNTDALKGLTSAVTSLENTIRSRGGSKGLNSGGQVMAFARGGVVPGTGNRDTVPAMLQPGEFVIRKKAVEKLGTGNLHRMNKYALGGKIDLSGKELINTYKSLRSPEYNIDTKQRYIARVKKNPMQSDYLLPDMINRKKNNKNIPNWKNFEFAVADKEGLSVAGGNKFLDYPGKPGEAKFLKPDEGYGRDPETGFIKGNNNETMLAKLIGAKQYKKNKEIIAYYPQDISKFQTELSKFAFGGMVQKLFQGGRGKAGARGARSTIKELDETELSQLSTSALIAYAKKQAYDVLTTGGSGMAIGSEFIEVPPERIVPELESDLVTYMGKRGFWREKVAPFGRQIKSTQKTSTAMDKQSALAAQIAKQADEVAAREQNWTAIKEGSDIDKYLLSTLQDPILNDYKKVKGGAKLDKPFYNTRLRQAVNKALEDYDTFDYSSANLDKLISGMAAERFVNGGLVSSGPISNIDDAISRIGELGGPGGVRGLIGVDRINKEIQKIRTTQKPTAKQLFTASWLKTKNRDSSLFIPTLDTLLKEAVIQKQANKPREFSAEEKNTATKLGLVGMFPFDINETKYEELAGRIVSIHIATLTKDKAAIVEQMRQEIDNALGNTTSKLYGTSGISLSPETKESLGLGNLEGYMIEAILAKAGANPGKLDDRSVDYAQGLGNAAGLFGIESNIPTEVKRDVKSGLSKARENFKNYFSKFAFGGKVGESEFEKVKKQIMDKYPQINFRISKRKGGFGYNILAGLKQEGDNVGNYADFQQASNLAKLTELADNMANQLQYKYGPDIDPSLLKKKQKFALGGLAEATNEMSGLMQGLYGNRNQEQQKKKTKEYGKIGLRSDGSQITATYFKNQTREGFVTAKKTADNLYTIGLSKATKGYGPRLYDIVMEAATSAGSMLTSDRNSVSGAARAVWDYYFNNRSDVRKTPLDPSQWTKNQSLIDPKLYGRKETWPPATDPAWVLQSGYSKNPELINSPDIINMNDPKYKQFLDSQQLSFMTQAVLAGNMRNGGGSIKKFAKGGSAEDTVPALLTPGEFVINRKAAKRIGYGKLNKLNQADKLQGYNRGGVVGGIQKFANGGFAEITPEMKERETAIKKSTIKKYRKQYREAPEMTLQGSGQLNKEQVKMLIQAKYETEATKDLVSDLKLTNQQREEINKLQQQITNKYKDEYKAASDLADKAAVKAKAQIEFAKKNREIIFGSEKPNVVSPPEPPNFNFTTSASAKERYADKEFLDYKARKEGQSASGYRYGLTQKIGKEAYETTQMYGGRKEEMKQELVMKQRSLGGVGSTIQELEKKKTKRKLTGDEETRLADAQTRLAAEAEKIANEMKSLNPTLDLNKVTEASKKIAGYLASGDLEKAQKELVKSLGDAPDSVEAMKIAMRKIAEQEGIDIGILEREFGGGAGAKQLKQQQFIQSREGQRFGKLAEFAPGLTQKLSKSKAGQALGAGADFISGKGGKLSKLFAGAGGFQGIGSGLAVGSEALKNSGLISKQALKDANVAGGFGAVQGAGVMGATGAELGGQIAGPVGALIGGVGGAIIGGIKGFFDAKNAQILSNALDKLTKSSEAVDIAFKELAKNDTDKNFKNVQKAFGQQIEASKELENIAFSGAEGPSVMGVGGGAAAGAAAGALGGAAVGSIVPILGTAIGAAVGGVLGGLVGGITAYMTEGQNRANQEEALRGRVGSAGAMNESAARMAERQMGRMSTEQLGQMQGQGTNIIAEQYKQSSVAAAEAANGSAKLTAEQEKQISQNAEQSAFLDAYMKMRKEAGATDQQISEDILKDRELALKTGKQALDVQSEAQKKQALLARATKEVALATESLLDVYRRVGAKAQRFSDEIDDMLGNTQTTVNSLRGNAKVQNVNRSGSERILGNMAAYSSEEVKAATQEMVGKLGGGEEAQALGKQAEAAKFLQDKLPAMLSKPGANAAEIIQDLRGEMADMGLGSSAINKMLDEIETSIGKNQDANLGTLADEISTGGIDKLSATSAEAAKTLQNLSKTYNDTLQKSVDLQNQYNEAIMQANSYFRKANVIRINAELDLAKALGNSPTLQQLNEPIDFEIKDLTKGLVAGGTTDPTAIANGILAATEQNRKLEEAKTTVGNEGMQGVTRQDQGAVLLAKTQELDSAIGNNVVSINEGRQALERLANDGTKAANALAKIEEQQRQIEGLGNRFEKIFTSTPEELFKMNKQSAALQAAQTAGPEQFKNLAFRQDAFAGLEQDKEFLKPEEYRKQRAMLLRKSFEAQGLTGESMINKGGVEMTLDDFLKRIEGGVSEEDPNVKAYREAVATQVKANEELGRLEQLSALEIQNSMLELQIFLATEFPKILTNAVLEAKTDSETQPETKSEERKKAGDAFAAAYDEETKALKEQNDIITARKKKESEVEQAEKVNKSVYTRNPGTATDLAIKKRELEELKVKEKEKQSAVDKATSNRQDAQAELILVKTRESNAQEKAKAEQAKAEQKAKEERVSSTVATVNAIRKKQASIGGRAQIIIDKQQKAEAEKQQAEAQTTAQVQSQTKPQTTDLTKPEVGIPSMDEPTKREAYLLRQKPQTRARLMTKAEKEAGLEEKLAEIERKKQTQPETTVVGSRPLTQEEKDMRVASINNPSTRAAANATVTEAARRADPNALMSPRRVVSSPVPVTKPEMAPTTTPTGTTQKLSTENTANMITIDPTSLKGLASFNKTFGEYVNQLVGFSFPPIEGKIDINHKLEVNMTGAASIASLDKHLQELAVKMITPKLQELETEIQKSIPSFRKSETRGNKTNA